ncbi:MAG TPA: hypothetical protein ENL09_02800 [Bacteroidetes bacterium]|nr:hypothetical protein [Bacteroidota bacterium]
MISKTIFQIEDVFSITGLGTLVVGTLKQGTIRKGMKTAINGKETEVLSIRQSKKIIDTLWEPGSKAALLLSNVDKKDITRREIYFK